MVLQDLRAGGAERVSILLANELAARGVAVGMALFRRKGEFLGLVDPKVRIEEVGGRGWGAAILPLVRHIRRMRPSAILGAMVSANTASVVAGRLARTGARILLTEHNQVDKNAAQFRGSKSYRAIPWLYPLADGVICVSEGVRESLLRYSGLAPERAVVIHNPIVSADILDKAAQPCTHHWFGDPGHPVLLAVGRLTPAKDYPTLLRAFAALRRTRPARLLILGEGAERPGIEALAASLGVAGDIELAGFTDNPYAYMARADLFVLASAWEGFPTVLVEALACGAPVVATDCPSGPREILCGGELGALVPVGDHLALAAAMADALDTPPPRAERVARGLGFTAGKAADAYMRALAGATP